MRLVLIGCVLLVAAMTIIWRLHPAQGAATKVPSNLIEVVVVSLVVVLATGVALIGVGLIL